MKFQLYQSHNWTAIGLKSGKKAIHGVAVGHFRDLEVTIKLKLQTSNFLQNM